MILGDLLGVHVYDDGGTRLGRVADARFVVAGAPRQLMAEARLLGLVLSPHSASSFLGYERTGLDQPGPLPRMLRWRHRGSGPASRPTRRPWTGPGKSRSSSVMPRAG